MIHNDILISFSLYNTLTSLSYSYVTTQIPILNSTVLYNHSKSKFSTLNSNKSLTSHSQLQNPHRTIQCLSFKLNFILSPTKVRNHYFLVNFNNNSHSWTKSQGTTSIHFHLTLYKSTQLNSPKYNHNQLLNSEFKTTIISNSQFLLLIF